MLRKMEKNDIPAVIRLHREYIPGALFPKLGEEFMNALYLSMMKLDCAANFVWEAEGGKRKADDGERMAEGGEQKTEAGNRRAENTGIEEARGVKSGEAVAFITVTTNSSALFRQVLLENFFLVLKRTLLYILGNPLRIGEIWETMTYSRRVMVPGMSAELLFIAIEKNHRKKEISDELVLKCVKWAGKRGYNRVKVTTYTTNRGANTLLERLGFELHKQVPFRNRKLNLYVYDEGRTNKGNDLNLHA